MPKTGEVLKDRYRVISVLGEGGFAAVYRADDLTTGAQVAVKVLDPMMSRRDEFTTRFLREVETISKLRHHNTIKVFDKGETANGCLFLVMELLEGAPVDSILEKEGTLAPDRVRRIAIQVLKSLAEAHALGIIHRDLKPANVFQADLPGEKDYIKVLDFGIAKSLDDESAALTSTGQVMCSPHYVAPERVADHVTVPASDIYSLGIMMIELLEGRVPYEASTPIQIVMMHARIDQPVPISSAVEQTPLGQIVRRAVRKPFAQRYQTATQMLEDLEALGTISGPAAGPTIAVPVTAQATDAMARKPTTADVYPVNHAITPPASVTGQTTVQNNGKGKLIALIALLLVLGAGGAGAAILLLGDDSDRSTASEDDRERERTRDRDDERVEPIANTDARVVLSSDIDGAFVRLDGRLIGETPLTLPLASFDEPPFDIEATAPDGRQVTITVEDEEQLAAGLVLDFGEDVAEIDTNSPNDDENGMPDDNQETGEVALHGDDGPAPPVAPSTDSRPQTPTSNGGRQAPTNTGSQTPQVRTPSSNDPVRGEQSSDGKPNDTPEDNSAGQPNHWPAQDDWPAQDNWPANDTNSNGSSNGQAGGRQTGGNQTGGNRVGGNQTGGNNVGGNQTGGNNAGGNNANSGGNSITPPVRLPSNNTGGYGNSTGNQNGGYFDR